MSLARRTSSRRISRPNARKALHRIERELDVLVAKAPSVSLKDHQRAALHLRRALKAVHNLYKDPK